MAPRSVSLVAVGAVIGAMSLALLSSNSAHGQLRKKGNKKDVLNFVGMDESGFPLNVDPEIIAASEAPIEEGDMVMGIVINGEARAYPVNYMNGPTNEVVNDNLGGQAIAPSW